MNRAYAVLQLKAADDDRRILTGIATTPTPDRLGDIVEPKGAEFALPIPFLWQHDSGQPIGHVTKAKVTKDGIEVSVQLAKVDEPGTLKNRLDEAWQSVKAGLVRGLSIGFKPVKDAVERLDDGGLRFLKWTWLELSAVTIPANGDATITAIKSLDTALLAASGREGISEVRPTPGASGKSVKLISTPKEGKMKLISEQIKEWEATRAAKIGARDAILAKTAETGETPDDDQQKELDEIKTAVTRIDKHLVNLRDAEKDNIVKAKPVNGSDPDEASRSRDGARIQVMAPKLDKGIGFARYALCLANSNLTSRPPSVVARQYFPEYLPLHRILDHSGGSVDMKQVRMAREFGLFEKAVAAGTTSDTNWATALVEYTILANEFISYLQPRTIIGQFGTGNIPSLNAVPFNIKVPRQTSKGTGYWVGEGKPKPLTSATFDQVTLDFHKAATIAAITQELARFSTPSAERLVREILASAVIERIDVDFIDPNKAASAGVSPASVTNTATAIVSGTTTGTAAEVIADVQSILSEFIQSNYPLTSMVWIMNQNVALALSLMMTSLGVTQFPTISMSGGTFQGIPVIVSQYVPAQLLILASAQDIYLADDGNVSVDVSREASLEMLSSSLQQDGTIGTGASLVSMFQTNMIAIRAEREITWLKRRTDAVQYMTGFNPGGTAGSGDI